MTTRTILLFALTLGLAACARDAGTPSEPSATAPAATAPATAVDPATAATISGKVALQGSLPKPKRIRMDAEPNCVALHKEPVYVQDVVVNANGTLKNAFVYVKEGLGNKTFATPATPVLLDQRGCLYGPHVLGLQAGQELHVTNSDPTTHNIHPSPTINREWNESQPPGAGKKVKTFAREELLIPVKCNVHPWMKSYIAVLKHPYFAVTNDQGAFEIKNLPPGDYTIEAWHESLPPVTQKITIGPQEKKSVDFTLKP